MRVGGEGVSAETEPGRRMRVSAPPVLCRKPRSLKPERV